MDLSLKISDYLAHGKTVIATEVGARGFDSFHDLLTLSSLDRFGDVLDDALKEIEHDSTSQDERGRQARERIQSTMDWSVITQPLIHDLRARIRS